MNDGRHSLNRDRARAILNKCAASIARIHGPRATRAAAGSPLPPTSAAACFFQFNNTPVPPFHIPDGLDGNEGHPARRFASACGAAGSHWSALMDGNEITGAAHRKARGAATPSVANCRGAAPVRINFFHNGEK